MRKNLFIISIAAILRLSLLAYILINVGVSEVAYSRDGAEYIEIAQNISQGNGYSICLDLSRHGIPFHENTVHPTAWRPPGYSLILAAIFKFGFPLWAVFIIQIFIDLMTLWLILSFPIQSRICTIAALLYAFSPQNIVMTSSATAETFLTFFLILGFYFVVKLINSRGNNMRQSILTGIFFGCASLFHTYVFFLPFIVALLFLKALSRSSIIILIISYMLILAPWVLRNYIVFHKVIYSSIAPFHITKDILPAFFAPYNTPEYNELRKDFFQKFIVRSAHLRKHGQRLEDYGVALFRFGYEWFSEKIKQTKPIIFKTTFYSVTRFLFVGHSDWQPIFKWQSLSYSIVQKGLLKGSFNWLKQPTIWLAVLINVVTTMTTFLGIVGFYITRKVKNYQLERMLFILIILYALIIFWPIGTSRYRTSVTPYIFMFSAYGFIYLAAVVAAAIKRLLYQERK